MDLCAILAQKFKVMIVSKIEFLPRKWIFASELKRIFFSLMTFWWCNNDWYMNSKSNKIGRWLGIFIHYLVPRVWNQLVVSSLTRILFIDFFFVDPKCDTQCTRARLYPWSRALSYPIWLQIQFLIRLKFNSCRL